MAQGPGSTHPPLVDLLAAVGRWPVRRWSAAVLGAAVLALLVGVPTAVVPTPFFTRMTAVLWWDYPVWAATAVLGGLAVATYVGPAAGNAARAGGVTAGGVLSAFAVGCPVCNKLVVAVIGVSGALNVWAPLQPVLALAALALLGYALLSRVRGEIRCPATGDPDGGAGDPSTVACLVAGVAPPPAPGDVATAASSAGVLASMIAAPSM